MNELKPEIDQNGIDYILVGDYYVPDLKLPEEHRPIGKWGRLHRAYLQQYRPVSFYALVLSGKLHTYLADLNEQATARCSLIIEQIERFLSHRLKLKPGDAFEVYRVDLSEPSAA